MKTKVKQGLRDMTVTELLGYSIHAVTKMTGNPYFTTPAPALVKITGATTALQNAYNLAQGAGPAQTAAMHQSRDILEIYLCSLGHYVEDVANDPVNSNIGAEPIILSAGMEVKAKGSRNKQRFMVVAGELPGTIELFAEAVRRGSHEWQYTTDIADSSGWIDGEPTVQSTTLLTGLESGKKYYFRHRSVRPEGPSAWDDPEAAFVI